jgi:hypothetical protein
LPSAPVAEPVPIAVQFDERSRGRCVADWRNNSKIGGIEDPAPTISPAAEHTDVSPDKETCAS